jgi:hypothetical protein
VRSVLSDRDLVKHALRHLSSEEGLTDVYNIFVSIYAKGDPETKEMLKTSLRRLKRLIEEVLKEVEAYEQGG